MAECKSVKSPESVRAAAHMYAVKQEVLSKRALDKFTTAFPGNKHKQHKVLRDLREGKCVTLLEFESAFGVSDSIIIKTNIMEIMPHPFYFNPDDLHVSVGSHFMAKAIDNYVQKVSD